MTVRNVINPVVRNAVRSVFGDVDQTPAPPAFIGSPYIVPASGPYYTGQELTVQYMASGFPTPTPKYEWYDVLAPIGGDVSTFTYATPTASAFAEVSLTNSEGGPVVDTTTPFAVIQSVLPAQTTPPVIGPAGSQPPGTVLTYDTPGVWTGPPGSGEAGFTRTFDWYRDGTIIPGTENQTSYNTTGQPAGAYTVREQGTNYAGGPILGAPSNAITIVVTEFAMLLESGDNLLLESGDRLLLEA